MSHDHSTLAVVDELWETSQKHPVIIGLNAGKKINEIILNNELAKVFIEKPCCLGCSDGRIHELRFGRAGQGIVAGIDETVGSIMKLHEQGKLAGGFTVTSHSGCGAAKIVCNQLIAEGKLPADSKPDELGIDFAKKVAAKLDENGIKVAYRHIESAEMDENHDERVIYFDGTGRLGIENAVCADGKPVLPRGFIFSGLNFGAEVSEVEMGALCGIALGDHGFGERFTSEFPFYIIVSALDEAQEIEYTKTADSVAKNFQGKVKVAVMDISGISIDK